MLNVSIPEHPEPEKTLEAMMGLLEEMLLGDPESFPKPALLLSEADASCNLFLSNWDAPMPRCFAESDAIARRC